MNDERGVSRRRFLRAAAGVGAVAGATGTAGATAEDNESKSSGSGGSELPDFGGYLGSANNGDAVEDARGTEEVTVEVGAGSQGYAFAPAGIWIDPGTTVNFEWTGEGGAHNVVATEDATADLDSGGAEATTGVAYEYTFEEGGITNYYCNPHQSAGMLGAIAVGEDVPTVTVGGGAGGPSIPDGAKAVGVGTTVAMVTTLGLAFTLLKYGGGSSEA
jgi:halocyanin-like protein